MAPKKGMEDYDPSSKYDHIFKAVAHDMNYYTEFTDLDGAIDESSWGFSGFCGDSGWRLKISRWTKVRSFGVMNDLSIHWVLN